MSAFQFFRSIYADNRARRDPRNFGRDALLYARNAALIPLEKLLVARHRNPTLPLAFIVGVPRSGSTLLYQLAARFLDAGYVTNVVARYWLAPIVGAARQSRATAESERAFAFESHLGRTDGDWAPHEFSWFFQHWMAFDATDQPPDSVMSAIDWTGMRGELEGLAGFFGRPLVMKNLNYVDLNIPWFAARLPQARFIWIDRDDAPVIASVLEARKQRYGSESAWWAIRPAGFEPILARSPSEQVAWQISTIRKTIDESIRSLEGRAMRIRYDDLVASPLDELTRLASFIDAGVRDPAGLADLRLSNRRAATTRQPDVTS